MRGIRKITKILWFPGLRPTDLARVGGKTKWMEVLVGEVAAAEGFRGWDHQVGGSRRWILMEPEGNLAVMVDQVVTKILFLGLEEWAKVAQVEVGTRVVEVVGQVDVMGGMEEACMEVPGGMTIVIVIAITMEEVTTAEGEEGTIVVGAVIVHVGEVVVVVAAEAVAGDTEYPSSALS